MDKRDFLVIENEKMIEKPIEKKTVTNPIAKKFVRFEETKEKFNVKDLFRN